MWQCRLVTLHLRTECGLHYRTNKCERYITHYLSKYDNANVYSIVIELVIAENCHELKIGRSIRGEQE